MTEPLIAEATTTAGRPATFEEVADAISSRATRRQSRQQPIRYKTAGSEPVTYIGVLAALDGNNVTFHRMRREDGRPCDSQQTPKIDREMPATTEDLPDGGVLIRWENGLSLQIDA